MPSNAPYFPIIYVRGFAMTQGEIDGTTADPFCGFNLGATVYRAKADKKERPRKFVFESPVVRLAKDFGYTDIFDDGMDIVDNGWEGKVPSKSIVVFRYYERASSLLGDGKTPPITEFAKDLSTLILKVRKLCCDNPDNDLKPADFKCYLVAHSMGGLVCRAFLQNSALDVEGTAKYVDKFFTYATPHNGIEVAGINVPEWVTFGDTDNFNQKKMSEYLDIQALYKSKKRVDFLPEKAFNSERVFCLIGTNRIDYEAVAGLSRTFVGHGSDGLVRIENASVWGINAAGKESAPCATAYVYRAHSGNFGIVNSEESFQNLIRFLFGDVRIDIWLDIDTVRLPAAIPAQAVTQKKVDALYQFEILVSPRGKPWYLTRRIAEEDSVACRTHKQITDGTDPKDRKVFLSTAFLGNLWKVNPKRKSLAYRMMLGVRVPDYEVDKAFWFDQHYEGGYLFRDSLILEMVPPPDDDEQWQIKYSWESDNALLAVKPIDARELTGNKVEITIDLPGGKTPGMDGKLRFIISGWNTWH